MKIAAATVQNINEKKEVAKQNWSYSKHDHYRSTFAPCFVDN